MLMLKTCGRILARHAVAFGGSAPVPLLLAVLAAGAITGCATSSPATRAGMTPQDMPVHGPQPYSIRVEARGGRETDPKGPSQISNEAFALAIADSMEKSRLFSKVVRKGHADYQLRVSIVKLEQSPPTGFSMSAVMEARWTLSRTGTGKSVWADTIQSSDTASAIASRKAVTRMRLATEGAARENIKQGIEQLSRIELR